MRFIYLSLLLVMSFVCSRVPQGTFAARQSISILPINEVDNATIDSLASEISTFFQVHVTRLPAITLSNIPRTGKYPGSDILDLIKTNYPQIPGKIIAITSIDICTKLKYKGVTYPNWGVLGISYLNSKPAVVSTRRLKDLPSLVKVCLHELGHTYGLSHCPTKTCLMHEGGKKANTQIKGEHKAFCPKCRSLL